MVRTESHFVDPAYARIVGSTLLTLGEATKHLHITTTTYLQAIHEVAWLHFGGHPPFKPSFCCE
jgi:hypothetical protein